MLTVSVASTEVSPLYQAGAMVLISAVALLLLYSAVQAMRAYRKSHNPKDRKRAIISALGVLMTVCFFLMIWTKQGIFMTIATCIAFGMMFFTVGDGIRRQADQDSSSDTET